MRAGGGERLIALLEAFKAFLALTGASGLLLLVHRDVQDLADRLVTHLHLNPAARTPQVFLRIVNETTPASLRWIALGALAYALLRSVEAVGLWQAKPWAEWLGILTGLIYLPFETLVLLRHPGVESVGTLILNLAVVAYLGWRLNARTRSRTASPSL